MRARFYTDTGRYMGWTIYNNSNELEIKSWLDSGNYILMGIHRIDTYNPIRLAMVSIGAI